MTPGETHTKSAHCLLMLRTGGKAGGVYQEEPGQAEGNWKSKEAETHLCQTFRGRIFQVKFLFFFYLGKDHAIRVIQYENY